MKIFNTLLFIVFGLCLNAQSQTIKGVVTGSDIDDVLIGASIMIKGTSTGTITDFDGNYELMASPSDTLQISYTGYRPLNELVGERTQIDIALSPDNTLLDEVVVIGYGIQKKRVATGSIAKLSAENLEGIQVQNVQSALEGQVAGLIVSESSGQPGSGKSILIRGVSTNGDNTPLFVVDGLQVNSIDNINPADVESVDVLKDAASAAIYGARGANGVVIITTKKGSEDGGQLNYEVFSSNSTPWRTPEMLGANDYIALTREKFTNGGQLSSLNTLGFPQVGDATANTNWMDVIFEDANLTSHRLSASTRDIYVSMEYWDQNGVIGGDKSNYKRYAIRLNGQKDINDYVTIGENIYINRVENQQIGENNAFGSVIVDAFAYDPLTEVFSETGQYGFAQSPWVQKEYVNPLSRLFLADSEGHADQVQGNIYAEIKPIEGLRFRTDLGIDYSWFNFRSFTPEFNYHPAFVNIGNDVSQGYGFNQATQFENYINYVTDINGIHNFDFVVGTSYREQTSEQAGGSTSFIPSEVQFNDNFQILDAGQDTLDLTYGSIDVDYRLISYYGRLIYNYDEKYLFSGTLRRDGSSNFGAANRFGIFPSFSAGWVLSDEEFFNLGPVSFMKLRASWGINGNDRIAPLSFASTVENVFTYPFGINQSLNTGASLATPPNPNIKWEESVQIDVGLEFRMWDDKLTGEIDYFKKNTKDLLMNEVIPGYIGATNNPISNLGEIQNTGIELALNYRIALGDLKIQTGINYTTFTNTVVNVAGDAGFLTGWSWPVRNTPITRMTEGFPVGHFVGYQTDGIFRDQEEIFTHLSAGGDLLQPNASPGDIKFLDISGDGVINSDDITDIGSPWPDHILGLSVGAQYKGFDFSVILSTQIGHDIYRTYERSDVTFTNYQSFWLDRWTPENPDAELPRLVSNDPNNNQRPSDFYVEDGTFLRIRNLQIGYTLPQKLAEKAQLRDVRVYLSANNIFTLTNYRGFDPEIGTTGWILDTGIDKGFYPSNRVLGLGLKVSM
jgi:TonB-linked SusC/RagA family outer membrane protein